MKLQGLYFDLEIDNQTLRQFSVVEFTLEEALSSLFTLTLSVVSESALIKPKSLLLKKAVLTVYDNGIFQRKIEGIISIAEKGKSGVRKTFYTIVVRPRLWMLTLRENSRIFHKKTVPEIMNQLMGEYGIDFDYQLHDPHPNREYTVQKRETDFVFFSRIAAEEGIIFWFENGKDKHEKCFYADGWEGLTKGPNVIYNPHPQAISNGYIINDVSLSAKMTPQQMIGKDRTYLNPDFAYKFEKSNQTVPSNAELFSVFDSYARFASTENADKIVAYRLQALQAESEVGDAESNCIKIMPGNFFTLSQHPDPELNADWQAISVKHHGHLPQSLEEDSDGTGAFLTNEIHFMSATKHWRAPFKHKPLADGPEVATVVGPAGEEIFTNELGQVIVHFHWNRYDADNENASCWVRVAQGWNGDGYGFYAIPRIGQEVIVTYLDGDIDRPLVTGCVFNANSDMPFKLPEGKTCTSFRSKTHKGDGFNEIKFDDTTSGQGFCMHAQKDMSTSVRNDRSTQVDNDHKENVDKNQSITIGVNQTESIGNNQKLSVGADQEIKVTANRTKTVGGNETLTVTGNQEETIKGTHTLTVTKADKQTFSSTQDFKVGQAQTFTVGAEKTDSITGLMKATYLGGHHVDVTGTQDFIVSAKHTTDGNQILLTAAADITLQCGSSTISLNKAGTIEITGVDIKISGTNITSTASADHVISGANVSSDGSAENIVSGGTVKLNP